MSAPMNKLEQASGGSTDEKEGGGDRSETRDASRPCGRETVRHQRKRPRTPASRGALPRWHPWMEGAGQ
eukprot:scaffold289397_cov30-Tisochrysis_lutea.AAC.2